MSDFYDEAQYQNMMRHLAKINDTLSTAKEYFRHNSIANAHMHCSREVHYSPIVEMLKQAMESVFYVQDYLNRDKDKAEEVQVAEESVNKEVYAERPEYPESPESPNVSELSKYYRDRL